MIQFVPLISWALTFLGVGGLGWYYSLSDQEKREADRFAAKLAWQLFEKTVDELSAAEVEHIHKLTKRHFG